MLHSPPCLIEVQDPRAEQMLGPLVFCTGYLLRILSGGGMQAPNVVSIAIIVAVIAGLEMLGTRLPALDELWVPVVVIVIAAIVKGLQVYLQQQITVALAASKPPPFLRRWLVG